MCMQWLQKKAKVLGTKQVLKYVNRDPETNIQKILNWLEKHDRAGSMTHQLQMVREAFDNKDGNWNRLVASLWTDIDDGVRLKLFETFLVNVNIIGGPKQRETSLANDCNVPWAILLDPTSACNLHCTAAGPTNTATSGT